MVKYFKDQMAEVVGNGVDLLFCNEEEALLYTGAENLENAQETLTGVAKSFVITLGPKGAIVFDGNRFHRIQPFETNAVDTNGAGDLFAGAFLYGITHGKSFQEAGALASLAASKVVSKFGPRLSADQASGLPIQLFG